MGREPDGLDDERTWQQPLQEPGANQPHNQVTERDAPPAEDEPTPPDVTDPGRTAPDGEISIAPRTPTGEGSSEHDVSRTITAPRSTSGDWDALPPPVFDVGQTVFEKYKLLEKIGEGGMGEVWRVWHLTLETERALKLIKAELAQNDKGWRRFQREARLMAKINHPGAVAVYDFRRSQSVAYIEMEFIRGRSLADVIKERRDQPMPVEWTARVCEQLCAVLHEAHGHVDEPSGQARPIIHRDLKPSNLMVVERKGQTGPPRLKVLDFGIAKIVEDEAGADLTAAGDLVGTPAYMSPEQIRGGFDKEQPSTDLDGRSDLYSTGVVLYHLLTGTLPFRGGKMALLAAHLNNPPMPMTEANPKAEVPAEVESVVRQCLEKDPANRPATARELSEKFLQAAGLGPSDIPLSSASIPALPLVVRPGQSVAIPVAAAIVLVAVAGLGVAMFARGGRRPADIAQTPPRVAPPDPGPIVAAPIAAAEAGPALWAPKGYEATDPNDIVRDHPGFPANLKRLDDETTFYYFADRVYLPEGYEPESAEDRIGDPGWPRALLRKKDRARFVYIPGAVYRRGAVGAPAVDFANKPIKSHFVRVTGFYIQDTEVTNAEIQAFAAAHPDDPDLDAWRRWFKDFSDPLAGTQKTGSYPAACVGYGAARRYARSVGGMIPTEAEWEWAAKSQKDDFAYAWGPDMAPQGAPAWARLNDPNGNSVGPALVKQYRETDKTSDNVYDMVGNVRELCADAYVPYTDLPLAKNARANPVVDERRPIDLANKDLKVVVKGGSFLQQESEATAFYRWRESPREIPADVGFRVVLECPPDSAFKP